MQILGQMFQNRIGFGTDVISTITVWRLVEFVCIDKLYNILA